MKELARRLASFGSLPLLGAISPLLVLPIIARLSDADEWSGLLTAQALGGFASTLIMFGWGAAGQARVAMTRDDRIREGIYASSIKARGILFIIVVPIGTALTALFVPDNGRLTACAMFIATSTFGFSMAWYAIGVGRASAVAAYDAVPRLLAAISAAAAVWSLQAIWIYPLAILVANGIAFISFNRAEFGSLIPRARADRASMTLAADWKVAVASISGALYASAPVPVATALGGPIGADVGSVDRLYRYALMGLTAFSSGAHAWVLDPRQRGRNRQLIIIALHAGAGVAGGLVIGGLGPLITRVLFGERLAAPADLCLAFGATFFAISMVTTLVQHLLIPFGRTSEVLFATVMVATLGVPAMIVGGLLFGGIGVVMSLLAGEVLCIILLLGPAVAVLRTLPRAAGESVE